MHSEESALCGARGRKETHDAFTRFDDELLQFYAVVPRSWQTMQRAGGWRSGPNPLLTSIDGGKEVLKRAKKVSFLPARVQWSGRRLQARRTFITP